MAYSQLEPFGAIRDNWHMAVLAQMYAAAHTRQGHVPPSQQDFMYKTPEEANAQNKRAFFDNLKRRQVKSK